MGLHKEGAVPCDLNFGAQKGSSIVNALILKAVFSSRYQWAIGTKTRSYGLAEGRCRNH